MLILGSCLALNLNNSGCCVWSLSQNCSNNGCYCDQFCHFLNDCCNDITDINCLPVSLSFTTVPPTPTDTLGNLYAQFYTGSRSGSGLRTLRMQHAFMCTI